MYTNNEFTKVILIDINGTLIAQGETLTDFLKKSEQLKYFKKQIGTLQNLGYKIGFCSDSPLPQLIDLAKSINLSSEKMLFIAENGNLFYATQSNSEFNITNNALGLSKEKRAKLINKINKFLLQKQNLQKKTELIAPEFLTEEDREKLQNIQEIKKPNNTTYYAFGANREKSISLFAPASIIEELTTEFKEEKEIIIDSSPQYNYFAIHQGYKYVNYSYRMNKSIAFKQLLKNYEKIIIIGDSSSDIPRTKIIGKDNIDTKIECFIVGSNTKKECNKLKKQFPFIKLCKGSDLKGVTQALETLIAKSK